MIINENFIINCAINNNDMYLKKFLILAEGKGKKQEIKGGVT